MTTTLAIDGMNCDYCVRAISRALETLPGVSRATVSIEREEAVIEHEPGEPLVQAMISIVEEEGYSARVQ